MNNQNQWRKQAGKLVSHLATDRRNARLLAAPWSRVAHSMVQGWRIRLSHPPYGGSVTVPRGTWMTFARLATAIANTRASHARRSEWHLWATRRVKSGGRYVPKAKRTW